MNHTTQTFARRSHGSGAEYAASIERRRRFDWSGLWIIVGCAALIAVPYLVVAWSKS